MRLIIPSGATATNAFTIAIAIPRHPPSRYTTHLAWLDPCRTYPDRVGRMQRRRGYSSLQSETQAQGSGSGSGAGMRDGLPSPSPPSVGMLNMSPSQSSPGVSESVGGTTAALGGDSIDNPTHPPTPPHTPPGEREIPPSSSSQSRMGSEEEQTPTSASASANSPLPSSIPDTQATSTSPTILPNNTTSPPSPPQALQRRTLRQIIKSSPIGRAGDYYSRMQDRRPYWTQLWCTLFIYLCGDLSAQLFVGEGAGDDKEGKAKGVDGVKDGGGGGGGDGAEGKAKGYDPVRTVRHLTVGAVACIPSYKWFMFLHNNFNYPSSKILSILTKVSVSQIFYTPIFNTYFFSAQSLLAGVSVSDTWERLKVALPTSIINSAKLWPAVTAFMFVYVDPQFRNVFAGCVAVGWQTYLSWLNQRAAREVRAAEREAEEREREGLVSTPVARTVTA
ncbi:hypothetical protein FQN50_003294 [Emmonsiellopsis sp. PD_5]|nr:hypothetical protein FQN50_003294 [Emmonsiellopsis sp. PD_5]